MKKYIFLLIILCLPELALPQKATLSGYIQDSGTGEKLIGATVYNKKTLAGTTTNAYGFFSITLDTGNVQMSVSYVGYTPFEQAVDLHKDQFLTIKLTAAAELGEVVVTAQSNSQLHRQTQMGSVKLDTKQLDRLPTFMGEKDIIKSIQLTPGVQCGTEGTSGLYVRGGGADQNLILLDGVPVYNATHLFGFFSVFNSSAINSVEIIKGGFPARYGGRISSVLDIKMKEGNTQKIAGEGSIGLISSKLMLEGPLLKDRATFMVSARRTYFDVLSQPFIILAGKLKDPDYSIRAGYYFYDLNAKVNYRFSDKSRLFLSTYLGKDRMYAKMKSDQTYDGGTEQQKSTSGIEWGNATTALRYNQILGPKLFSNATLTYSRYRFEIGSDDERNGTRNGKRFSEYYKAQYLSGIFDWGARVDLDYHPHPDHYVRFGGGETYHTFKPGAMSYRAQSQDYNIDAAIGSDPLNAHELHFYAEDDIKITGNIKVNPGLHYSVFFVEGKTYQTVEPRISGYYLLTENISAKAAYTCMSQYMHLLTSGTIGLPTDLWVPVTDSVPPMIANQYAAGLAYTLWKEYEFSTEVYYKDMKNLIEYKDGASFMGTAENWERKIEVGNGNAYGMELFAQKKTGKTTGWIGYTLSWSNRQFDNLNEGRTFAYKYDRRHDISVVAVHSFDKKESKRWRKDIGMTWVYGTGNAVSLPTTTYKMLSSNSRSQSFDYWMPANADNFSSRNDYREPAYHRMDLSFTWSRTKGRTERSWNVSLYNAYNQHNPFYLYFKSDESGHKHLMKFSLLPILPSLSYSIKF